MHPQTLKGHCLCGEVRFTAIGEEVRFYHCHCSRCRRATGTGHASNLFLSGTLTWDSGEDLVRRFDLPKALRFSNCFCSVCGSRVPRGSKEPGTVMIPAGCLNDEPQLRPQARIFTDSRAAWSCTADDLPSFKASPH